MNTREHKISLRMSSTIKQFTHALQLLVAATLLIVCFPQPAPAGVIGVAITTCEELQNIRIGLAGDYYLANDIDCTGFDYGDGKGFMPIGDWGAKFTGTFDGKGYKITGMFIDRGSSRFVGLFGYADSGSEIKNVSLEGVDVRGGSEVGGLVGCMNMGTITNSYSSGSVSGNGSSSSNTGVGGLVGYLRMGTITNSYSSGSVIGASGVKAVGGLVGRMDTGMGMGTITNSYSSSSVSGDSKVGGLVGLWFVL